MLVMSFYFSLKEDYRAGRRDDLTMPEHRGYATAHIKVFAGRSAITEGSNAALTHADKGSSAERGSRPIISAPSGACSL
jgi:hypothetical protein